MRYFTKVLGQPISSADAYAKATPAQRATWWPTGAPVKVDSAGPAGVELMTGASLAAAKAAGERALREGFGSVLPDGQAPCGTCASCTYGHLEGCRRPVSKAMAVLRRQQDNEPAQVALRQLAAAEGALLAHGF